MSSQFFDKAGYRIEDGVAGQGQETIGEYRHRNMTQSARVGILPKHIYLII